MKKLFVFSFIVFSYSLLAPLSYGQNKYVDSLKTALKESRADTNTVLNLLYLGYYFENKNADSVLRYFNKAYEMSVKIKNNMYAASTLMDIVL